MMSQNIYHGIRHYAVHSRDVGTFGGRAKRATIKVYDSSNCGQPLLTVSGELVAKMLEDLGNPNATLREFREQYLQEVIQHASRIGEPALQVTYLTTTESI
jgi:hypothetical protein